MFCSFGSRAFVAAVMLAAFVVFERGVAVAQDAGVDAGRPELVPPRLIQFVEAEYPEQAERDGVEAVVGLQLTIDREGRVTDATVIQGVDPGVDPAFDEAAVAAARQFVFEPARRNGEAVPARIGYRYVFELRPAAPPEESPPVPQVGALEGGILDRRNQPIAGAEIILTGANAPSAQRAVTGADGRFRFEGLSAGEYTLRVIREGYEDVVQSEQVAAGEVTDVTYRPAPAAAEEREGDTFGATAIIDPPPREVTRRTLRSEELMRIPGTRGDALRAVEILPGVGRPPFGAGVLIIRGSAPEDSEVFLEGSPVPLLYHFGGLTSFINSNWLDHLDFFPGNFSARYGRRMGGILEVGVRDPMMNRYHAIADVNFIDASALVEGPIGNNASVGVAARRSYIDFFFDSLVPEDSFDVVAAPVYWDYQLISSWRPSARDRVRLLVYGSSDEFRLIFNEPSDDDPAVRGNLDLRTAFHRGQALWQRQLSSKVDQEVSFSIGPTNLTFGLGEDLRFEADFLQMYGRAEWRARVSPAVRLIGGLDIGVTPAELHFRGPQPGQTEGNPDGEPLGTRDTLEVDLETTAFRPSAYVETDLRPIRPLQVILGLRLDWYNEIEEWAFDPRSTILYSIDDATRIKAGVGLFSQPPEFQESERTVGNPNLEAIHATHLSLGVDRKFAEGITMELIGFYKHLSNRVVETENNLEPHFTNDGIGRIYGLEFMGRIAPLRGRRYFGFVSYTLSRSERNDRDDGWRLFDFDQTHILNLAAVYLLGRGWEIGATYRLVSGNPYSAITGSVYDANADLYIPTYGAINARRNPLFHRLDLRIAKKWRFTRTASLELYLDIQNAYNATNREGVFYNYDYSRESDVSGLPIIPNLGLRGEL